jgi:molybdopterin-guanine dinucleotide biosynthesis protein
VAAPAAEGHADPHRARLRDPDHLVEAAIGGDRLALARILTAVENRTPVAEAALRRLYPMAGKAHLVGITGPPGSGKSTLVSALIGAARAADRAVAVVAVDPSSPITGGALLGDRVRMQSYAKDRDVFIRSMASRGHAGGLASTSTAAAAVLDAAGFDLILLETVGTGQSEVETVEQGMILENLGLMAQALGLGGFPNFANHEFAWFQALDFQMEQMPASRYLGAGRLAALAMKFLGRDPLVPYAVGLERNGEVLLKPFCPPHYESMREAVEAVVESKFGARGVFRDPVGPGAWGRHEEVTRQIPAISSAAIKATVAYCEYVWDRYGRFPVYMPPYRTVLGFQACHLDAEFYDRFYRPEALSETERADFARHARV